MSYTYRLVGQPEGWINPPKEVVVNAQENPNAVLEEVLIDAVREAVSLGLPLDEARLLCYGCGIDSQQVLNGADA